MWFCTVVVTAAEARAAEQSAGLQYEQSPMLSGNLRAEDADTFWGLFKVAFDHRAAGVFEDQFHPFNLGNWNALWRDRGFSQLSDYQSGVARHAFVDTFRSSARDAALGLDLPVLEWMRERQGFLADFLWNSLDSVEEQSVSPLDPSYRSVERSWWNEQSDGSPLRYGVRPFRTDPYAYLSWAIKDGDTVWLLGNARYHFRNFGDHDFELALSLPIAQGFSADLGTSYQFGTHPAEKKVVLKLLKTLKSGGILHVALEARQQPTLIAGITLPW
jgi:hypothetical protein